MKISIGINGFKPYDELLDRERFCIDSLIKLVHLNDNITLYNICYEHEDVHYDGFETIFTIGDNTHLPHVNSMIETLALTECDQLLFMNNDIIVSQGLMDVFDDEHESYAISRVHLRSMTSLDELLDMQSYSVHGFDAFGFRRDWFLTNKDIFPDAYIGKAYWDVLYFVKCITKSKCKIVNKLPPVIFHIEHQSTSCKNVDKYLKFNEQQTLKEPDMHLWWSYVQNVLLKRHSYNDILWYMPFENEEILEKEYFNIV
tara:strand:+ start:3209 stop:3979 length:771 start_codon:yes stop_codon:yes gene_type:complete